MQFKITPIEEKQYLNGEIRDVRDKLIVICKKNNCNCSNIKGSFYLRFNVNLAFNQLNRDVFRLCLYLDSLKCTNSMIIKINVEIRENSTNIIENSCITYRVNSSEVGKYISINLAKAFECLNINTINEININVSPEGNGAAVFCSNNTSRNPFIFLESIRAVGPIGPQGPQGPVGPRGPRGPQGERGPIGPRGARGETGEVGPIGPEGAQGPRGPRGIEGAQGPEGPEGPVGEANINTFGSYTKVNSINNSEGLLNLFNGIVNESGSLEHNNNEIIIGESGNYRITFSITIQGGSCIDRLRVNGIGDKGNIIPVFSHCQITTQAFFDRIIFLTDGTRVSVESFRNEDIRIGCREENISYFTIIKLN